MGRIIGAILAGLLPWGALAQDAVIRIEAKRGATAAEAAAAGWAAQFDNVVTFPLQGSWVAIALGPMQADAAAQRLATLKAAGAVPADSFVADLARDQALTRIGGAAASDVADSVDAAQDKAAILPPASGMTLSPFAAAPGAVQAAGHYLRLEAFQNRAEADTALTSWRAEFPGAGLWELPNGWFAVALGPLHENAAKAWHGALVPGKVLPKDTLIATTAEMGQIAETGAAPDLAAPPAQPAALPPLDQVQAALRWAGHYDGAIDGRDGRQTRAAIAAEIAASRVSADPGTAMQALLDRRAAWRVEMGLEQLRDAHTGLSIRAPMSRLAFDRSERALSIYGPRDGSGAALILFSQPGGQQEMIDLSGLVTALGWVPQPTREITRGQFRLRGQNDTHIGEARGRVRDGRAEGWVLIWPVGDAQNQARIAAELADSMLRSAPAANDAPAADADGASSPAAN